MKTISVKFWFYNKAPDNIMVFNQEDCANHEFENDKQSSNKLTIFKIKTYR